MEFYDESDSEGLRLKRMFSSYKVKSLYLRPEIDESVNDFWHRYTTEVYLRNHSARKNGEPLYQPALHISCHGSPDGIHWINSDLISWEKLADLLWYYSSWLGYVISPSANGAFAQHTSCISLSLSCCHGAQAERNFFAKEPFPVGGFVAPNEEINIDDAAWFFCSYHYRRQTDHPWNIPDLVQELSKERQLRGPNGPVFIEHYVAPLTANHLWKSD